MSKSTMQGVKRTHPDDEHDPNPTKRMRANHPPKNTPDEASDCTGDTVIETPIPTNRETPYEHDSRYYIEDGDIILKVDHTLFRVHCEKLKAVGGLFEVLFSIPQPKATSENEPGHIDGVPVCNISLASAIDMHFALGFIYGDLQPVVSHRGLVLYHWDAIAALVRVGTKLDLPLLRDAALEYLASLFPWDFADFASTARIVTARPEEKHRLVEIEVINVATQYDIPGILPLAYYWAAQLSIQDLIDGFTWHDGTHEKLDSVDLKRVLHGRERLKLSRRHTVFRYLNNFTVTGKAARPSRHCIARPMPRGDTCFFFLMRLQIDLNTSGFHEMDARGLEVLPHSSLDLIRPNLCESCWDVFEKEMYTGRMENWRKLPRYFGLESWEEVMSQQAKAKDFW